ncbi:leucine-rich repeat domain-containing protein [Butyrivibrio sp. INlla16]|uniref:leucine-rich repeat domain-containing protein n=1 Tax=Butyrivibrio sp. INlla16 TaxID=1520807 RepID=UPI00088B908A|nr:leucine-rich repeat domain-containing protein [Butyrivibrio sp. INlla16]SDB52933.1 Leucine rich repeat-containing protein [Butyrivibrio sp. INlla16]
MLGEKCFKKLLLIVTTVVTALIFAGSIPGNTLTAHAATSGKCGPNATWRLSSGTLYIEGSGDMWGKSEYANTSDLPAYGSESDVSEIVIGDDITSIGDRIFNSFSNLKTVTIGKNVDSIGQMAFEYCKNLENVNFPTDGKLRCIKVNAFNQCGMSTIALPDSVKTVEYGAFHNCPNLKTVKLSSDIEIIEESVFESDENLENINLPEGLRTIYSHAFASCKKLAKITIPSTVWGIGDSAFSNCGLTELNFVEGSSYLHIDENAFAYNPFVRVSLHDHVDSIGKYAFSYCSNLEEINIPLYVSELNEGVFLDTNVSYIKIPKGERAWESPIEVYDFALGTKASTLTIERYSASDIYFSAKAFINSSGHSTTVKHKIIKKIIIDPGEGFGTRAEFETSDESYTLPECTFEAPAGKHFVGWLLGENEYALAKQPLVSIQLIADLGIKALWESHDLTKLSEQKATCTENGHIECWHCSGCDKYFSDSDGKNEISLDAITTEKATGHDWGEWVVTKEPTETEDGIKTRTCKNNPSHTETEVIPKKGKSPEDNNNSENGNSGNNSNTGNGESNPAETAAPKVENEAPEPKPVDTTFTDEEQAAEFVVTSADKQNPTVDYKCTTNKKAKKITVPQTVTLEGVTYNVTGIASKAFNGCKKLKTVSFGDNIENIRANAFKGAKNLKTINAKSSKLTKDTLAKKAFKGIGSGVTVKVPKKMKKTYEKLFVKKGLSKSVKIK